MLLAGDDFDRLFQTFESSAFKMETRDRYSVDGERDEFRAFLDGGDMPKEWEDSPWVHSMTRAGKALQRVHILRSPLSDYLRFELGWGYVGNVRAGARVYRMHYNDDEFLGAEALSEESLPLYRAYRDAAWQYAIPYAEYWQQHS